MAHPPDHAFRSVPATPSAFSQASTGAAAFQSWLEEEEEEWCLGRILEANCPKEFICPISLDIMSDPIILVETGMVYDRHNIRKWLLLGGSTCPLTGVKLITKQVVSHRHLRQRIDRWVATGGTDSAATLAEEPHLCVSEASYQVLTQGAPQADRQAQPDSPRTDSIATSAGYNMGARRMAHMFERLPSEASSMGGSHSRRHVAPRRGPPTQERKPQPNVSRSSLLLCKFSSSALSRITAGSSRDTTPVAVEEEGDGAHNAAEQNRGVDLPGDSIDHPAAWTATTTAPQAAGLDLQGGSSSLGDLPAAGAVAPTSKPQSSLSVTQPGTAASSSVASKQDAAAVARLWHRNSSSLQSGSPVCAGIPAPPCTPKTPVAPDHMATEAGYGGVQFPTASRSIGQADAAHKEEMNRSRVDKWSYGSARGQQGLLQTWSHMDQAMLAQAHAAMLTIESEGWTQERIEPTDDEARAVRNRGLSDGERELLNRIISEESPRRSYAEDAPVADAQPEGDTHAQDQSEVLAALEEALADDVPSSLELVVAADPGASGASMKSSSSGSANICVIATADMVVRRPRNRVSCLGGGLQPKLSSGGRRQVAPGVLYSGQASSTSRSRHRRAGSVALQTPQSSPEKVDSHSRPDSGRLASGVSARPELTSLPPRDQSRARPTSGWARCFGCNVAPSMRGRGGDCSGATSRMTSMQADRWVEGSDEEVVTVHDFARHVIAAAAKQDAADAAHSSAVGQQGAGA